MTKKKTTDERREATADKKRKAARIQTRPEIEMLAVDRLVPYAKNAKKHDDRQVAAIAGSIREFGFTNPVLIDGQDGIIAGHGRVLGARKAGLAEVPCIRLAHLTDAQRRAYILADNRLAETGGGWDAAMLAAEVEAIDWEELESFGLDDMDLGEILAEAERGAEGDADAEPQVDRAEELNKTWKVKPGDLWKVGGHRLLCGDSTKAEDVQRVLDGKPADSGIADPPYNVGLDYGEATDDTRQSEQYWEWQRLWFDLFADMTARQVVTPGCVNLERWIADYKPKHVAVWDKGEGANTYGRVTKYWAWEPIMCHGKFERIRHTDVFRISALGRNPGHPCPKPLQLWTEILSTLAIGETIYEPFTGSGTTMVAGQNLGRRVFGLEISPAYCAVILQRMADAFPGIEIRKADA